MSSPFLIVTQNLSPAHVSPFLTLTQHLSSTHVFPLTHHHSSTTCHSYMYSSSLTHTFTPVSLSPTTCLPPPSPTFVTLDLLSPATCHSHMSSNSPALTHHLSPTHVFSLPCSHPHMSLLFPALTHHLSLTHVFPLTHSHPPLVTQTYLPLPHPYLPSYASVTPLVRGTHDRFSREAGWRNRDSARKKNAQPTLISLAHQTDSHLFVQRQ